MTALRQQWYFAYGSNLDRNRLETRIHRHNVQSHVGYLEHYELSFNKPASDGSGYAMVSPKKDGRVYGVLYLLSDPEFMALDRHEGVPNHYRRKTTSVTALNGESFDAESYFPEMTRAGLRPRREYLSYLVRGASYHELPDDYVNSLNKVPTFD